VQTINFLGMSKPAKIYNKRQLRARAIVKAQISHQMYYNCNKVTLRHYG
jgi:hypothetical protein